MGDLRPHKCAREGEEQTRDLHRSLSVTIMSLVLRIVLISINACISIPWTEVGAFIAVPIKATELKK